MLKLNPDPTFSDEVQITVPGQKEPGTIPLTFKYRNRDEFKKWFESLEEKRDDKGKVTRKGKTFTESFLDFVTTWGLKEEFNKTNVEIFLTNYPAAYQEIFTFYSKMLFVSRVKN